jgi:hypothetical protein
MAETLGSLCDKLTIIKLKQWHSNDDVKLNSLNEQEIQLINEINEFLRQAVGGEISIQKLIFNSNKVYKQDGNEIFLSVGDIGNIISNLSLVNINLWHEQEKVYDFEKVPNDDKNNVVKQLAVLNLQRNKCIEQIDSLLVNLIKNKP